MNIFETASRKQFRYASVRGDLTTEQLWHLPLKGSSRTRDEDFDLDSVARGVNAELKSVTEESFVAVRVDARKADLETKLDVLKHIIAVRLAEVEAAKSSAERAEKRRKLLDALASKENEEISAMAKEDILKQLAELEAA